MKRIKLGSVEILGYTGIAIWVAVFMMRQYPLSANATYWFWLGILPNLGAAWFVTMLLISTDNGGSVGILINSDYIDKSYNSTGGLNGIIGLSLIN